MSCGTDGRALRPPRNHQPLAIALTHPPPAPFHACRHAGGTVAGVTCHAVRRRAWRVPGGRLPVIFPKTVGQLPFNFPYKPASHASQSKTVDPNGFGNSMAEGALYPFGFGLSYSTFDYSNLQVSPAQISATGEVTVACDIKNTGASEGDEVAQLYFHQETSSVTTYELNLCGFERLHLKPGESKAVSFKLPASALQLINREGKRVVEPGIFKVKVGSTSEDLRLTGTFEVVAAPK